MSSSSSLFVELDPLEDGFAGVLVEVHRRGGPVRPLEIAPTTGRRLLRFSSKDRDWTTPRSPEDSATLQHVASRVNR
jgi:hypothetical protein